MATRKGIQVKYNPQTVVLPPVLQNNSPGATTALGFDGRFPEVDIPNATVRAIATMGDFMFLGGFFTDVGGNTVLNFATVRISTGKFDSSFKPAIGPTDVRAMVSDGVRFLYVVGNFTSVDGVTTANGQPIRGAVRFDMADGGKLDDTWNPLPNSGATFATPTLALNPDKKTLYIGDGLLTSLGGTTRNFIGEVSTEDSGTVTTWNPNPNSRLRAILYDSTIQQVYLGGDFITIQAAAAVRLVRMTTTGAGVVDATWLPAPGASVQSMLLDSPNIYVGGIFVTIGATPVARNRAARIDNSGEAMAFDPNLTGASLENLAISRLTDKTIRVGGVFKEYIVLGGNWNTVGGTGRAGIAVVDAVTGALNTSWDAGLGGVVPTIFGIIVKGQTIYMGGSFTGTAIDANDNMAAIPFPIVLFDDTNSKFFRKTGDDTGAGTRADPFLTIDKALTSLGGAFVYAVCLDSGIYEERIVGTIPAGAGLVAEEGNAPTITLRIGAKDGTFGARVSGRTKFSTGAFPSTFVFVSKAGNDGTGTRGDQSLPFLTLTAAFAAVLDNDTVQIDDSGTYEGALSLSGFTGLTLQAKDGETPLMRYAAGATGEVHIKNNDVALTLDIFGITIQTAPFDLAPDVIAIQAIGPMNIFDCTFVGGAEGIDDATTGASKTVIENCLFDRNTRRAIEASHKVEVKNSYFLNSGGDRAAPVPATIHIDVTADGCIVDHCTFENSGAFNGQTWNVILAQRNGSSPTTADDFITFCDFLDTSGTVIDTRGVQVERITASPTDGEVNIEDCRFSDLGRQAILGNFPFNGTFDYTAKRCIASRCQAKATTGEATYQFLIQNLLKHQDLISIESGQHGFVFTRDVTAVGGDPRNMVAINSAADGFNVDLLNTTGNTWRWTGIVESGSTGNGIAIINVFAGAALTERITYSIFQRPGLFDVDLDLNLIATYLDTDPKLISTVSKNENLSFFANSVAIFSGDRVREKNMGVWPSIITITQNDVLLSGFKITGPDNLYSGITVDFKIADAGLIEKCTFTKLGQYAILAASGYEVENCLFENSGIGILVGEASSKIQRNIGNGCGSAFLVASGNHLVIKNNTGYLCDFGQFDRLGVGFDELKNNVYSQNGQADYSGEAPMSNSDVENLDGNATIISGTRLNPLFRDTEIPDLRLQTIDSGFFFDSPAKGLGDDGGDAGAFDIDHGQTSQAFTLVDLEEDKGGGVIYRNPSYYMRKSTAIKLSEGTTHGGLTYSEAAAFKREHVLTWEDNTDMPAAQVTDLEAIYTTGDGECQLSFDGGTTFIQVHIVRGSGFQFTEIADANYNNDSIPTPVAEMVFRDSL